MFKRVGPVLLVAIAGAFAACTTNRVDIEGNETGGFASRMTANESDVLGKASAHCAKWGRTAKITFIQPEIGSNVVFICETPVPAPSATLPPSSPAPKRPPTPPAKQ